MLITMHFITKHQKLHPRLAQHPKQNDTNSESGKQYNMKLTNKTFTRLAWSGSEALKHQKLSSLSSYTFFTINN